MHSRSRMGFAAAVAVALVAAFAFTGCGGSDEADGGQAAKTNELVINSFGGAWGEAIQAGFIDGFQQKTGIRVKLLKTADPAKSSLAVKRNQDPPEDVIDVVYSQAKELEAEALLAPIEYDGFDQDAVEKIPEDSRYEHAIGFGKFALGICYDKNKFPDGGPRTWADFWDFEKFPGKRGMLNWKAEPQPEFGLLAEGVSPQEMYPIDEERALAKLEELVPQVPRFVDDPSVLQQQLVDGTVVAEACYTHRVQKLINAGAEQIAISYDEARLQPEYFVVWKNAPNKANAMAFLDYMISAQAQAAWARAGRAGPLNPEAFDLLEPEVIEQLPTSPDKDGTFTYDQDYYAAEVEDGTSQQERWGQLFTEVVSR